jgi:hypothetical protein
LSTLEGSPVAYTSEERAAKCDILYSGSRTLQATLVMVPLDTPALTRERLSRFARPPNGIGAALLRPVPPADCQSRAARGAPRSSCERSAGVLPYGRLPSPTVTTAIRDGLAE